MVDQKYTFFVNLVTICMYFIAKITWYAILGTQAKFGNSNLLYLLISCFYSQNMWEHTKAVKDNRIISAMVEIKRLESVIIKA